MRPLFIVLVVAVGLANARWMRRGRSDQPRETSFVGKATNEMSTAIMQSYIDDDKNIAFSPLGYSAILAILAEGARGETREQLVTALRLPDDPNLTRKTFRYIMERLKFRNEYKFNQPELKNYFYIYKNYTINEDYKKILEDYYLTDVRSVEKYSDKFEEDSNDEEKKPENNEKVDELPDLMPSKETEEKLISFAVEDKPEKVDVSKVEYKPAKNIKEKIKLVKTYPKKEEYGDEEETMVAVEARNHARSLRILNNKNDITSSISVNSVGHKSSKSTSALMLIFNGMYFRGSWEHPFHVVEPGVFYKSNTEKKQVTMMKSRAAFKTTLIPDVDSDAVLFPYEGGRYALLIYLPRTRDGLTRLIADLPSAPIPEILESLCYELMDVSIPIFNVETTTKPVSALAKFGVSRIFGREAELSGVSAKEGLFVQELVQNVAVRVDNAEATTSFIGVQKLYMKCLKRDYTTELFTYLLITEAKPTVPAIPSVTRACIINWLIKVNGADGDIAIVQTACFFLDSILGTEHVPLHKLQLAAAACYWVSQKLRGPSVHASRLVRCSKGAFTAQQLTRAERVVLLKLKFPCHPVIPDDYIGFLSWSCDKSHPGEIALAATFLCMAGLMVTKFLCLEYPSVVAAAAVRNSLLLLNKVELLERLEGLPLYKAAMKKTMEMATVCSIQIKAVRQMMTPGYEYRAPFEHYGCAPYYIAQRVVIEANDLATACTKK